MRLIQFIVLAILVMNGLMPVITDSSEANCIDDIEILVSDGQSEQSERESEDSESDNDLSADRNNHLYKEPRPTELGTNFGDGLTSSSEYYSQPFVSKDIASFGTFGSQPKLNRQLKRRMYFSKSKADCEKVAV